MTEYWADRRRRGRPPLDRTRLRLLQAQHGRCPLCADLLLHTDHEPTSPREWEQWLTAERRLLAHTRA
jgi:RNA-directed DNA polymerase